MNIVINEKGAWYHGSNRKLKYLRKGRKKGYLYIVDEPIKSELTYISIQGQLWMKMQNSLRVGA